MTLLGQSVTGELEIHHGSCLKQPKVRVFLRMESRGKGRKVLSKAETGSNALEGQGERQRTGASSLDPLRLPLRGVRKLQEDSNLGRVNCMSPSCVKQGGNC